MHSQRVWASNSLSFQLAATLLTCSLHEQDQDKTVLMQKIYSFQTLPKEVQILFQEIGQFWHYIKKICKGGSKQITLLNGGTIHINLQIVVAQRVVTRKIILILENSVTTNQEVIFLRNKIDFYGRQLQQLKEYIREVQRQNTELKIVVRGLEELRDQSKTTKAIELLNINQDNKVQENSNKETKQSIQRSKEYQAKAVKSPSKHSPEPIQRPTPLPMIVDDQCMYYNKFQIFKQQVTSLHEDYYQLYFRDPLPIDCYSQLRIKMVGKNHCSFGIFCRSQKNNQYSFQNNKSVCFYSYYEGNFQGIYNRGKYLPLAWKISQGSTNVVDIRMKEQIISFWVQGREEAAQLDFSALLDEGEDLFFFIEMYQKGNCVQFQ